MKLRQLVSEQMITEKVSEFQKLKNAQVPLTPEERRACMDQKAVWHFNKKGPSPAVWKAPDASGKMWYITNTHRAWQKRPTLKGAIHVFHNFIKGTA